MSTFDSPIVPTMHDKKPSCPSERGNARECSLDYLIVSSSPSHVQELYQDDGFLLLTPHQLLDNVCNQNKEYKHENGEEFSSMISLLPRRSRLYESESRRVNLGGSSLPYTDQIFRSSQDYESPSSKPFALLPSKSRLNESENRRDCLCRDTFPGTDENFPSSHFNESRCISDSYLYCTPKKEHYKTVSSPPALIRHSDENFGRHVAFGKSKLLIPLLE
mmetsp:Transcript_22278/g.33800  ORF Transcript_22278/g.33800 Transcript_22278/m.33800 type:complete len:219 (-) Transcript_22278:109-765(-)